MSSFMLEILTSEQALYWGQATSLTVRAIDGEAQILPRHAPYVTVLAKGEIRLHTKDNTCLHFDCAGGTLEVSRKKVSVLITRKEENNGSGNQVDRRKSKS